MDNHYTLIIISIAPHYCSCTPFFYSECEVLGKDPGVDRVYVGGYRIGCLID